MPLPCMTLPRKKGAPDSKGVSGFAGQEAVGLDLHRRIEVVVEVVIGDVGVGAGVGLQSGGSGNVCTSRPVIKARTDCDGIVNC